MFEAMNHAIAINRLCPVVDRVFAFEDAPAALAHVASGAHFGKVVIRM
jgi:NADPH:quinone reductase-like Zn-dependent oxidoreductase